MVFDQRLPLLHDPVWHDRQHDAVGQGTGAAVGNGAAPGSGGRGPVETDEKGVDGEVATAAAPPAEAARTVDAGHGPTVRGAAPPIAEAETAADLGDEYRPEGPTAHAVDDEVDGRVERHEHVGRLCHVTPDQLERRALDDRFVGERHLQGVQDLRDHRDHVRDDADTDDDDDDDGDSARRLQGGGGGGRRAPVSAERGHHRLGPEGLGAVAVEATEVGGAVGVGATQGGDDERVQPDENDRRGKVVNDQKQTDSVDYGVRTIQSKRRWL